MSLAEAAATAWQELVEESIHVRQQMGALTDDLARACDMVVDTLRSGNKLILVGNGGSAADAQHIAAEFVGRFKRERPAWAAIALSENVSSLTGIGNDYSYDIVFSRQLEALGRSGDLLIALTTSGTSPNVVRVLELARELGLERISITGPSDSAATELATLAVRIPAPSTASVQEGYMLFLHALCQVCEDALADAS